MNLHSTFPKSFTDNFKRISTHFCWYSNSKIQSRGNCQTILGELSDAMKLVTKILYWTRNSFLAWKCQVIFSRIYIFKQISRSVTDTKHKRSKPVEYSYILQIWNREIREPFKIKYSRFIFIRKELRFILHFKLERKRKWKFRCKFCYFILNSFFSFGCFNNCIENSRNAAYHNKTTFYQVLKCRRIESLADWIRIPRISEMVYFWINNYLFSKYSNTCKNYCSPSNVHI